MPGVSRVNQDTAGGKIIEDLAPTVFVNNKPIAVYGAHVQNHGDDEHQNPTMKDHSASVSANGIKICREGDAATCGHAATGSGDVFAG